LPASYGRVHVLGAKRKINILGGTMTSAKWAVAALATLSLGATAYLGDVRAGGDKIAFPANYDKGVLYTTVDRPDNKQYRELFATPEAVEALKAGKEMPSGTVLTLVQYRAKLDAAGNPEKDTNGRFIKGDLIGYTVMEKRSGWGTEYPDNIRNGEWEYQAFTAARAVNEKANLKNCFVCHKPHDKQDFVFSFDAIKAAAGKAR
jgi:hypothetical protein